MDPLSALACLASAAAEASPSESTADGGPTQSTILSVEVPQSVSLSSTEDASTQAAASAAVAAHHYSNHVPPPSSHGGGTYNSQYNHQQPTQTQIQHAQPATTTSTSHRIFSYSSQLFAPEPAASSILSLSNPSHHAAYQNGHGGQPRSNGMLCGPGQYAHASQSSASYGAYANAPHDDAHAQRKPPSLAKYMASLGKGMPLNQRKSKRSTKRSSASLGTSRSSSRSSSPTNSASGEQHDHSDGGAGGGPPEGGIITEDDMVDDHESGSDAGAGGGGGRSKRKSAKAARNYLQRVMREGQGKKSTAALANGGPQGDNSNTSSTNKKNSANANGRKRSASPTPGGGNDVKKRKRKSKPARVVSNDSTPDDGKKANGYDDSTSDTLSSDVSSSEEEEKAELEPTFQEVKAADLDEESRVFIAYRTSLYKATIRKVRSREGKDTDYLIHYDGNKKSNVHWVSLSQFRAQLDEQDQPLVVPPTPEEVKAREERKLEKEKRRKAREERRKKKEEQRRRREARRKQAEEDADHDIKNDADDDEDESDGDWEYARGKDVYVECDDKLYRCTILNRRRKKGHYQYFVYWDGFKKTHNSWVKEDNVEKITAYSSRRFNKQNAEEDSSDSEEEEEWEYPIGKDVYVEYDDVLYRATVMNRRTRKGSYQYLVHYDGYKKASDGWVKEDNVHKITAYTSRRYNKQNAEDEAPAEESESEEEEEEEVEEEEDSNDDGKVEEEEGYSEGTVVYVEYNDLLYRATVMEKRMRKGSSEFYVHYDGYKKTSDRWVKYADVHKRTAYTSRRYNKERRLAESASGSGAKSSASTSGRSKAPSEADLSDEDNKLLDMKGIQSGVEFLPGSSVFVKWKEALYLAKMVKRRIRAGETEYYITYNGFRDSSNAWVSLDNIYEINPQTRKVFEKKDTKQVRSKSSQEHLNRVTAGNGKKNRSVSRQVSRQSSTGSVSGLDGLERVEPGVTFMPGSTLFAKVGTELHLAKMVKKRGSTDTYMEYFVSYTKKKKTVDAWVKLDNCYEIDAQTKRIYNKQSK